MPINIVWVELCEGRGKKTHNKKKMLRLGRCPEVSTRKARAIRAGNQDARGGVPGITLGEMGKSLGTLIWYRGSAKTEKTVNHPEGTRQ